MNANVTRVDFVWLGHVCFRVDEIVAVKSAFSQCIVYLRNCSTFTLPITAEAACEALAKAGQP